MAETEPPARERALLRVRRKRSLASSTLRALVKVDGKEVGSLGAWRRRSLQLGVDPGTHSVEVVLSRGDDAGSTTNAELEFTCEAGERITLELVTWIDVLVQRGGFKLRRVG